jgi:ADP-ribosylglycohydrolase
MISQTNPKAIRFGKAAAALLEQVLLGNSLKVAMERLVEHAMSSTSNFSLDDADIGDACLTALMEAKTKENALQLVEETLADEEEFGGRTSKFPAAFIVPLFLFYKAIASAGDDITEETYVEAIRENIEAGGDSCCRAIIIGAILAAAAGKVPDSFVEKFVPQDTLKKVDAAVASIIESIG